jgi:Mrp family chromosome partitioning ATPase/capsular polysaccharide biosynthesis protein
MSVLELGTRGEQTSHYEKIPPRREYVTFADIAQFVRRYLPTILACTGVTLAAALLYVVTTKPIYTATAEVLIDPKLPQPLRESGGEVAVSFDAPQLESQIAVFRSEAIAASVVEAAGLDADPEFNGEQQSGLWARLLGRTKREQLSKAEHTSAAVAAFRSRLLTRRIGISYAIEVSFPSESAEKAARIVNATTAAYLKDILEARASAARVGSEWLEERVGQLRLQMNSAARRVQEFKASHDYRIPKKADGPLGLGAPSAPVPAPADSPATTLDELESTASTYRKIYENFYQAFAEAVQRESYPVSNARVISSAIPPTSKSHPKSLLILALGGLLGGLVGTAIAIVRQTLNKTVRDPRSIRDELGMPCLGQIPKLRSSRSSSLRAHSKSAPIWPNADRPHSLSSAGGVKRLLYFTARTADTTPPAHHLSQSIDAPLSPFGVGMRRLKTGLSLARRSKPFRLIGITSALPGEGKTTIAANLAAQFATKEQRTLLVDADLYRRTLSRQLAPDAEEGILEIFSKGVPPKSCIRRLEHLGIDLLPVARHVEERIDPDLLGSEPVQAFLDEISAEYTTVLFDLPPLKLLTEGFVLGTRLDGLILVAESEMTPLSSLEDVLFTLRSARVNVLGCVINKVGIRALPELKGERAYAYLT